MKTAPSASNTTAAVDHRDYVQTDEIDDFEKRLLDFSKAPPAMQTASVSHAVLESSSINRYRNIGVIRSGRKKVVVGGVEIPEHHRCENDSQHDDASFSVKGGWICAQCFRRHRLSRAV